MTSAERKRFAILARYNRPEHTRWRTTHGVCDRFGADATVYTGECQRPGCRNWFCVERRPADVKARWPLYCSESCRYIAAGTKRRRNARKVRSGETSGKKRPLVHRFDPDKVELPYWAAMDIVQDKVTSTPTAYWQASEYLEDIEKNDLVKGRQGRAGGITVSSSEWNQSV
ncbi:hypothetical protein [Pseudonocardia sp. DLS-67]